MEVKPFQTIPLLYYVFNTVWNSLPLLQEPRVSSAPRYSVVGFQTGFGSYYNLKVTLW